MENRNPSATKGDVEALETRIENRFHAFEQRIEQLLSDLESRISVSDYRLAESITLRLKQNEANQAAFNARLAVLEERLTELEKLLNIPPQRTQ